MMNRQACPCVVLSNARVLSPHHRQSNDGRGRIDKQEQQQAGREMQQQPSRQDAAAGRQQQLQQKGSGAQTPLSPNESEFAADLMQCSWIYLC